MVLPRILSAVTDYGHTYLLGAENDIPELQVDLDIIDKLKHRVSLARRIDAVVHKHTKADHEKNWLKQAAKDLDVEIDPDFVKSVVWPLETWGESGLTTCSAIASATTMEIMHHLGKRKERRMMLTL